MPVLSDYHLHTSFSADSEASMEDQIQAAIRAGMESICFTEHLDPDSPFTNAPKDDPTGDFHVDYSAYRETFLLKKIRYAGTIRLFFGLELGLRASMADTISSYVRSHPDFDFIIGSTHSARNGMDPYYASFFQTASHAAPAPSVSGVLPSPSGAAAPADPCVLPGDPTENPDPYRAYFEQALANVRACRDYDTYGHLDYIFRCGPMSADGSVKERTSSYLYERYQDLIDPILFELILQGKALEINTSPLKKGFPETNPGKAILKRYHDYGGRMVTIGSDAHAPEGVAYGFDRAAALLRECGFTSYVTFEQREPVRHAL